jgi:hypothetical protein
MSDFSTICEAEECDGRWHDCWNCGGEGISGGHDCGEDACPCAVPEEGTCRVCNGKGGWACPALRRKGA